MSSSKAIHLSAVRSSRVIVIVKFTLFLSSIVIYLLYYIYVIVYSKMAHKSTNLVRSILCSISDKQDVLTLINEQEIRPS